MRDDLLPNMGVDWRIARLDRRIDANGDSARRSSLRYPRAGGAGLGCRATHRLSLLTAFST